MNWIRNNFRREFPPDGQYLVGVSGGRDSVALLHWLVEAGYKRLIVCHLNHQLRGRASDTDARFVEKLVASYKERIVGQAHRLPKIEGSKRSACSTTSTPHIALEIGTIDVRALATKKRLSIEMAARNARYEFFARLAKRTNCPTIFLAHHADDVVETFLINLFRGSGTTGLAAIREVSKRPIGSVNLTIVRPLLGVWRVDVDRYVRANRLKFREDASNKNLTPLRNRIRRRVIPYLEKTIGRNIRQSIWRAAMIAAEEEIWIESQFSNSTGDELPVGEMRELPIALQRRQIMKWLRAQNVSNIGFDIVESVRALLDQNSRVAKINLPRDRHARRRARKIFITD